MSKLLLEELWFFQRHGEKAGILLQAYLAPYCRTTEAAEYTWRPKIDGLYSTIYVYCTFLLHDYTAVILYDN